MYQSLIIRLFTDPSKAPGGIGYLHHLSTLFGIATLSVVNETTWFCYTIVIYFETCHLIGVAMIFIHMSTHGMRGHLNYSMMRVCLFNIIQSKPPKKDSMFHTRINNFIVKVILIILFVGWFASTHLNLALSNKTLIC